MALEGEFFTSYYFLTFFSAWFIGSVLKGVLGFFVKKKDHTFWDGFSNGGMPSTHTASVVAITSAIGLKEGFTDLFFVALVFSLIVISDAFVLRQYVGIQGELVNKLLVKAKMKTVKIVHGHTFMQVIGGTLLGFLMAVFWYSVL